MLLTNHKKKVINKLNKQNNIIKKNFLKMASTQNELTQKEKGESEEENNEIYALPIISILKSTNSKSIKSTDTNDDLKSSKKKITFKNSNVIEEVENWKEYNRDAALERVGRCECLLI